MVLEANACFLSECESPRSQEVTSSVGLEVRPIISPLASAPIDVSSFDIPEARQPLLESPVAESSSPLTIVLEVDQKLQSPKPATKSVSLISASSAQSHITCGGSIASSDAD
jgi:hypothetical protein